MTLTPFELRTKAKLDAGGTPQPVTKTLLTAPDGNTKIAKNQIPTWSLNLAPANSVKGINVCPMSTPQCRKHCLVTAGRNPMSNAENARIYRTQLLRDDPVSFVAALSRELDKVAAIPGHKGVRLNALSDIWWEKLIDLTPWTAKGVVFYDYTARPSLMGQNAWFDRTFSIKRHDQGICASTVMPTHRIAMVAAADSKWWKRVGSVYNDRPVVHGDLTDFRPLDPPNAIVLLSPKGSLRKVKPGVFIAP